MENTEEHVLYKNEAEKDIGRLTFFSIHAKDGDCLFSRFVSDYSRMSLLVLHSLSELLQECVTAPATDSIAEKIVSVADQHWILKIEPLLIGGERMMACYCFTLNIADFGMNPAMFLEKNEQQLPLQLGRRFLLLFSGTMAQIEDTLADKNMEAQKLSTRVEDIVLLELYKGKTLMENFIEYQQETQIFPQPVFIDQLVSKTIRYFVFLYPLLQTRFLGPDRIPRIEILADERKFMLMICHLLEKLLRELHEISCIELVVQLEDHHALFILGSCDISKMNDAEFRLYLAAAERQLLPIEGSLHLSKQAITIQYPLYK
ncbi:hypothetical protein SAMN05421736_11012 [Evansella caseinilytica]|uniref:Uncharacterized protein n=1 Tax=Evansella caseinilytica TaxID=1503961 RepID=A0A1H3S5F2_9BACI|nr:hypothetical protein [Evansella caseinilytica]SDZ33162.1 hypothetical protein SAMN05421736_11012 [Evansella caseinilytica]